MSETLSFSDFRGGLWIVDERAPVNEQAGFAVPDNALLQADNVEFLPAGGIRGRRGSTLHNASPLTGPVQLLYRYYGRSIPQEAFGSPTGATSSAVGTVAWQNPAGIERPIDPSYARADFTGNEQTQYLFASAPFADAPIPANAVITGITVTVTALSSTATSVPVEASVRLFQDFQPVGEDKSTGAALTSKSAVTTYGSSTDVWGVVWDAAAINGQGFGVGISYQGGGAANSAYVMYATISVNFSASEPNAFLVASSTATALTYSKSTGSNFTPITGGTWANPQRRPHAISWPQKGKVFFTDGVNPMLQWDGREISAVEKQADPEADDPNQTTYLNVRRGPYLALHKSRLYATEPGELAYSVYASEINNERAWRPDIQISVNDDQGGTITGLASLGDNLLIFKDTCIWRLLGDPLYNGSLAQISRIGCVAPDTIQSTPFGVVFLGRDGVYLCDGDSVVNVSAAIRPLFVERNAEHVYQNAVGVYYPRQSQYWLRLNPAEEGDGYVLHRVRVLQGDGSEAQTMAWSRIPGLRMNCGCTWDGDGDTGQLFLGDTTGYAWQRDVGTADFLEPYSVEIATSEHLMAGRSLARVNRLMPVFRAQGPVEFGLRYDQRTADDLSLVVGDVEMAPAFQEPRQYIGDLSIFGRFLSLRIASNEGPEFELHRVDCVVRPRAIRAWR